MTRETKVGLLIGLGVILLIGIIVSDHLAVVEEQQGNEEMLTFSVDAQRSIRPADPATQTQTPEPAPAFDLARMPTPPQRQPILTPNEVETRAAEPAMPIVREQPRDAFPTLPRAMRTEQPQQLTQQPNPAAANPLVDAVMNRPVVQTDAAAPTQAATPTTQVAAGQQAVPSPAPLLPEPAVQQPQRPRANQMIHYVKSGENLTQIAKRYYGDGKLWREIAKANPKAVDAKGRVYAKARLLIPSLADLGRAGVINAVPTASRGQAATGKVIDVKSGDTLSALAAKHLGSSRQWSELLQANRDQLASPEQLRVGMKLRLPATQAVQRPNQAGPDATQVPQRRTQPAAGKTYAVRSGDTLYSIARKTLGNGDRWTEVFDANRDSLDSADDLAIGQTLRIPG